MSNVENDLRIDYIEFPATDIAATKEFYAAAFGWTFTDYGPDYTSFNDGRLNGGFTTATPVHPPGALVVLYAVDLEGAQQRIVSAGGEVTQEIYEFPGGRRLHFRDPNGNELAVWAEGEQA
jgi:predicted enzyme related to lactoylglutathione lyase